ncbi:MAG TPA: DUF2116 family Zn-ribbon domain-containing protein [Nitrososphaeria archaeon]|nr:DUF2116 family Zn-ribbon domain-containing protein [Nitrososphaeria archaeon]
MSRKKAVKLKIVDHRHCMTCGKAIPPDKEFCSEECRKKYERVRMKEERVKKMLWIMYAVMIGSLLIVIVLRTMIH